MNTDSIMNSNDNTAIENDCQLESLKISTPPEIQTLFRPTTSSSFKSNVSCLNVRNIFQPKVRRKSVALSTLEYATDEQRSLFNEYMDEARSMMGLDPIFTDVQSCINFSVDTSKTEKESWKKKLFRKKEYVGNISSESIKVATDINSNYEPIRSSIGRYFEEEDEPLDIYNDKESSVENDKKSIKSNISKRDKIRSFLLRDLNKKYLTSKLSNDESKISLDTRKYKNFLFKFKRMFKAKKNKKDSILNFSFESKKNEVNPLNELTQNTIDFIELNNEFDNNDSYNCSSDLETDEGLIESENFYRKTINNKLNQENLVDRFTSKSREKQENGEKRNYKLDLSSIDIYKQNGEINNNYMINNSSDVDSFNIDFSPDFDINSTYNFHSVDFMSTSQFPSPNLDFLQNSKSKLTNSGINSCSSDRNAYLDKGKQNDLRFDSISSVYSSGIYSLNE